ncbi:ribosomal protein S6 kinase alpha-1/2/3/6 [Chaetoceros tenuissimus]|uniref:Ribosomal protein S6 kinase alpha-1/2/3/6 n=1 Tax=Chaetoceros tenuissimus TaxID=426638 RepID=A0AAD3D941_9STRA|nr:ribosomal protein S6 kinase alpha-1/2/3/6 [Chaetoceros tenuissimus]
MAATTKFLSKYDMQDMLGKGAFGSVWKAIDHDTDVPVAVKVIDRRKLKPKDDKAVYDEVAIMKDLSGNDSIVQLLNFYESEKTFHVVLELAMGGDVFERLSKRRYYKETDARELSFHLLNAVSFIHSKGYVHRDLKPENLLLRDESDDSDGLMVADFGFAVRNTSDQLKTRCGTPAFVAPEICVGVPYGSSVDVWSCGVILYLLLGGYAPFQQRDMRELFRKIRAADYSFHEKYWDPISMPAKQLIARMLTVDPTKRITAEEALKSKWMTMPDEEMGPAMKENLSETIAQMKKFVARNKLRGAMIATTYATTAKFWAGNAVSFMSKNTTVGSSAFASNKTLTKGKVGQKFDNIYQLDQKLRQGRISGIWKGARREAENGMELAIKVISVDKCNLQEESRIMNEVAILQSLNHPNILRLHDFFEESPNFFIVMELMEGGDVFDKIVEKTQYTEKDAKELVRSLLKGVEYIHTRRVAHRDLKPQNLLLASLESDVLVKIADFSFARRVHTPKSLFTRCGTPTYVAPEILKNHPHDESADMWSVGVIAFVALVGYPPFIEEDQRVLFRKIRLGEYCFYDEDWEGISADARDLISKLLIVDPDHRCTASQAINHKWITGDDSGLSTRDISASLKKLKTSMGSIDEDNQPENKNYQSFGEIPNESVLPM